MVDAYICDAVRTPVGLYGGALSSLSIDELAANALRAVRVRNAAVDWSCLEGIALGRAEEPGEEDGNVARKSGLLAGFSSAVEGVMIDRHRGSGMEAVALAVRAIRSGALNLMIAGGVESISRGSFVGGKTHSPFVRDGELPGSPIGQRCLNLWMRARFGADATAEAAEDVAANSEISRAAQDRFALRSQQRYIAAHACGAFDTEVVPVLVRARQRDVSDVLVAEDEHPRETTLEALASLPTPFRNAGSVTVGNASWPADGAVVLLVASGAMVERYGLVPLARVVAATGDDGGPRAGGLGAARTAQTLLRTFDLPLTRISVIEFDEAFAARALAVIRDLGLDGDDPRVNANGGAIAIGHPLAASGARLIGTAAYRLQAEHGRYALCTMGAGIGPDMSMLLERV